MERVRLHVTSGHPVATNLRAGGVPGEGLSWPDVLHEGPVPGRITLDALSYVRAPYLADRYGLGAVGLVLRNLLARNARLRRAVEFDEVTLWFGHHLADQLRLIQLLDWLARNGRDATCWTLVCIDRHPDIASFRSLDQLCPSQFAALDWTRRPVTDGDLALAQRAWSAFTAAEPRELTALTRDPCWALPQLPKALRRHLQQFPGRRDGLARTERDILGHVALRGGTVRDAFEMTQRVAEEAPYMGGATFLGYVEQLARPPGALLEFGRGFREDRWSCALRITQRGREVLSGRADRYAERHIDRWLGGVYLEGPVPAWCWDESRQTIAARRSTPGRSDRSRLRPASPGRPDPDPGPPA